MTFIIENNNRKITINENNKGLNMDTKKILKQITPNYLKKLVGRLKESDLSEVINQREKLFAILAENGALSKAIDDVKLLFLLLKDYYSGVYRDISWKSISAVIATIIYILNPLDLVPDALPVIGQIDDLAVLGVCLNFIKIDFEKYKIWKKSEKEIIDIEG